jgi:predicted PurR-regulated permease PerM
VPLVGPRAAARWDAAAAAGPEELSQKLEPYVRNALRWIVAKVGGVGAITIQFLLTVVIAAILYARGEMAASGVSSFFVRLAGPRARPAFLLAGQAIRGVALGVVLTALIQSVLGGIGLGVAGVPLPGMLTAVMFLLSVAQVGPGLVLVPAVIWTYWTSDSAWMPTALLIWSIFVGTIDNFIRPILIQRGGDLPLLIVFSGVIGGLLTLGLVGIFVGPVVLAVTYTLLETWIRGADPEFGAPETQAQEATRRASPS